MNNRELVLLIKDEKTAVYWLIRSDYTPNIMFCGTYRCEMVISVVNNVEIFRCSVCKNRISIF
jgi:hypothetical protein